MPVTALLIALLQVGAVTASAGGVHGTVRGEPAGLAVSGVRVEWLEADGVRLATSSDSAGAYALSGLPDGARHLRFSRYGYRPVDIDVLLQGNAPLRLDVTLSEEAAPLLPVRVVAHTDRGPPGVPALEGGARRFGRADVTDSPTLAEPDAFRLLATAAQAQMTAESPAIHVRGGSADQNLVLVDGLPAWEPLHSGEVLGAINPDVVDELVLHGATPSARYGGRLSGIVDVRTTSALPDDATTSGGFGPTALRGTVAVPLAGRAGLVLSGRHSYSGLARDAAESEMPGAWADAFTKLTLRLAGGELSLLGFGSENGLGFAPSNTVATARRNSFDWRTSTRGATWRQPLGAHAGLEFRAWDARVAAGAAWLPDSAPVTLASALRDRGASAEYSRAGPRGALRFGVEAQRLDTRYDVRPIGTDAGAAQPFHLAAGPRFFSSFAEQEWRPSEAWRFVGGLRGTVTGNRVPYVEPRLSVRLRPIARLELSAGYGRMHQFVQSLRNEESLLGTIIGLDLPMAVGAPGISAATSDELSASAGLELAGHATLALDAFARRMDGVVMVAPATGAPFARSRVAAGDGTAWGLALSFERRRDRLTIEARGSVGGTRRVVTEDSTYRPAFAFDRSALLAAAFRPRPRTQLRGALWLTSGRSTTPLRDDIAWDTRDGFSGERELSGSPEHAAGSLDATRLPMYLRVDLGLRQTLPLRSSARGGEIAGFATLTNAFGRANATGIVLPSRADAPRPLEMLPRSLILGFDWRW